MPHVRESGHGASVLCLHANASSSCLWRGLMDRLSPRFRVLAPDLVGHSYGAALALAIAQAAPQRVASAVLYEPTAFRLLNRPRPGDPTATSIAAVATASIAAIDRGDAAAAAKVFIDYWMGAGSWAAMAAERCGLVALSMQPVRQWTEALYAQAWRKPCHRPHCGCCPAWATWRR